MSDAVTTWTDDALEMGEASTITFETGATEMGLAPTPERFGALVAFFNADAELRRWQAGRYDNDPPYNQAEADALFEAKRRATTEVYRVFGVAAG
jgi:hypothetical protein